MQFTHDLCFIGLGSMLQQSLYDTAAIRVGSQGRHLPTHSVHNEVNVLSRDELNNLLDNMVAVLILDYSQDLGFQFPCQLGLLFDQDVLKGLKETW